MPGNENVFGVLEKSSFLYGEGASVIVIVLVLDLTAQTHGAVPAVPGAPQCHLMVGEERRGEERRL